MNRNTHRKIKIGDRIYSILNPKLVGVVTNPRAYFIGGFMASFEGYGIKVLCYKNWNKL